MGGAVLPAVEAMHLLAVHAGQFCSGMNGATIRQARFDKFLEIAPAMRELGAYCDMAEHSDGTVAASLLTRMKTGSAGFTRTKVHARVVFPPKTGAVESLHLPMDSAVTLKDACFHVEPERIYAELVPFGPAYRNICQPLKITDKGVLAVIQAPDDPMTGRNNPLGSPFVLDAAFQAACVWGQRFTGVVAFPVGMDQRRVLIPTIAGEDYACRVIPVRIQKALLVFDLWILDADGQTREVALGVQMRDVSGGRVKPPQWVMADR